MKNEITYTEHNGLYYPDLALPEQTNYTLGKYANLRLDFIKKHRRGTYTIVFQFLSMYKLVLIILIMKI